MQVTEVDSEAQGEGEKQLEFKKKMKETKRAQGQNRVTT